MLTVVLGCASFLLVVAAMRRVVGLFIVWRTQETAMARRRPAPHPVRRCNGGPYSGDWCGRVAVVVCTERTDGSMPLQWYACEERAHQNNARTEPIAAWFARVGERE